MGIECGKINNEKIKLVLQIFVGQVYSVRYKLVYGDCNYS